MWLIWLIFFPILLPAKGISMLYRGLKYRNDINAIRRGKVGRRIGRRIYGKATGRLAGRLFR